MKIGDFGIARSVQELRVSKGVSFAQSRRDVTAEIQVVREDDIGAFAADSIDRLRFFA